MRIDKYLKVSRLIKRREIAKQLCLDGDVIINNKSAKPMSEINNNDQLILILGKHKLTIKVKEIREFANKIQADNMYELISDEVSN